MFVLILRSAHAEEVSQMRARVRASRRMTTAAPSCFETHRSARRLRRHLHSRRAPMLLSTRAGARRILAKRTQVSFGQTKRSGRMRVRSERSTNLRMYGMTVGSVSLFPACYLQGTLQLQ